MAEEVRRFFSPLTLGTLVSNSSVGDGCLEGRIAVGEVTGESVFGEEVEGRSFVSIVDGIPSRGEATGDGGKESSRSILEDAEKATVFFFFLEESVGGDDPSTTAGSGGEEGRCSGSLFCGDDSVGGVMLDAAGGGDTTISW